MTLSNVPSPEILQRLKDGSLLLNTGPFTYRLQSSIPSVAEGIAMLYGDYSLGTQQEFVDFSVALDPSRGLRRFYRPQVRFSTHGYEPFEPLPIGHAYPMLEWAMNWCVYTHAHHYLLLHAAVVERNGFAMILPAPPGSGKSTLCAALIHRGWRLLSDEMALISLDDQQISALCRPVSLKNRSIEIIQHFAPNAVMNSVTHDTTKGSVCHMKVPTDHVQRIAERAIPRWVVFPRYVAGSKTLLTQRSRADSMLELGRNSFNYVILGLKGFETLSEVMTKSCCYDFCYSQLDEAIEVFEQLATT